MPRAARRWTTLADTPRWRCRRTRRGGAVRAPNPGGNRRCSRLRGTEIKAARPDGRWIDTRIIESVRRPERPGTCIAAEQQDRADLGQLRRIDARVGSARLPGLGVGDDLVRDRRRHVECRRGWRCPGRSGCTGSATVSVAVAAGRRRGLGRCGVVERCVRVVLEGPADVGPRLDGGVGADRARPARSRPARPRRSRAALARPGRVRVAIEHLTDRDHPRHHDDRQHRHELGEEFADRGPSTTQLRS